MRKRHSILFLIVAGLAALAGAGCSGDDDGDGGLRLTAFSMPAARVAAREIIDATVELRSGSGAPRANVDVAFAVERGGGSLDLAVLALDDEPRVVSTIVRTDESGRASVRWRAGIAPVRNQLVATVGAETATFDTRVMLDEPLQAEEFGDIPGFLRDNGYAAVGMNGEEIFLASTEDLAFVADDRLLLGLTAGVPTVNGALIEMTPAGDASLVELSGEPLVGTLGVALDREGVLWVADPRGAAVGALVRISTAGVVETALTEAGGAELIGPNYVAIGPDGKVYLSDPCRGIIVRYDPSTGSVDAVLQMDVATEGGPNGLAFDASGENLYFATESIALLCARGDLDLTDPVASLFRVPVTASGFGAVAPIALRQGLFGDGLGFDAEGNLYVIFDTQENLMLEESAVWVLPAGETELVKFLANGDRVYANLAWGRGAFGDETMYIALLAVDAFNLPVRGVERISLGIPGLPLLP